MRRAAAMSRVTAMAIRMTTERALYKLMTWLSPAFPVGAFSYSHGIEWAVEDGQIRDEASLQDWIAAGLAHEFGAVGAVQLRAAYESVTAHDADMLRAALEDARAWQPTREFAIEALAQGKAFVTTLRNSSPPSPALTWALAAIADEAVVYPCAIGIAAAIHAVPLQQTLIAYFQAFAANLMSAGLRLIPLGQTAGQRILAKLEAPIIAAAEAALMRDPGDVGTAAPLADIASMKHETQYTRLFRS
jgi:urease accessory protein